MSTGMKVVIWVAVIALGFVGKWIYDANFSTEARTVHACASTWAREDHDQQRLREAAAFGNKTAWLSTAQDLWTITDVSYSHSDCFISGERQYAHGHGYQARVVDDSSLRVAIECVTVGRLCGPFPPWEGFAMLPASAYLSPVALCADGTYSYSPDAQGTCSHHGGVSQWYR